MSLNKILLIGNLGADPEIRYTTAGKPVAKFSLATNRTFKIEGELRKETEWFSVVAFGRLAEICSEFLQKGRAVFVEGRIATRSWADAQGAKHFRTEVIAQGLTLMGRRNGDATHEEPSEKHEDPEPF